MAFILHILDFGDLKFELHINEAPNACKNFLALAASDYYNGSKFHRNIRGFILQGGDATGTGKGGTSIFDGQPFPDEISQSLKHDQRGVLSMANSGKDKNLSQFFITYAAHETLDNKYTIFGQMIDGEETLNKLNEEAKAVGKGNRPLNDIIIEKITILANPIAEREWEEN